MQTVAGRTQEEHRCTISLLSNQQEGALEQLWYVDAAYLAAVTLANFCFPYILLPTALNPMQLMIPPNDVEIPMAAGVAEDARLAKGWRA